MRAASDGVGRRLYEARMQRDVTMDQLADRASLSQAAISLIEKDKIRPTAHTIEKLARGLEIDPCWLAYGTGSKPDWLDSKDEKQKGA